MVSLSKYATSTVCCKRYQRAANDPQLTHIQLQTICLRNPPKGEFRWHALTILGTYYKNASGTYVQLTVRKTLV